MWTVGRRGRDGLTMDGRPGVGLNDNKLMLTHPELLSLAHLLRPEKVLSVYVDGAVTEEPRMG